MFCSISPRKSLLDYSSLLHCPRSHLSTLRSGRRFAALSSKAKCNAAAVGRKKGKVKETEAMGHWWDGRGRTVRSASITSTYDRVLPDDHSKITLSTKADITPDE